MKNKLSLLILLLSMQSGAGALEVLHWWTAPGEFEAQLVLRAALEKQSVTWENFAIVSVGGDSALRVLQMRALSGNPPDVAQIKGPDIAEWAKMGMLKKVDDIIASELWTQELPDVVKQTMTYQGNYMAVPVNIHRVNWLWLNKAIFDELNLKPPKTWAEFFITADKIKQAGYTALAHGGTSWQDSLLFESIALSKLGAERYKQAFVMFDEAILTSNEMIEAFETFKRLNQYVDSNMHGKDWVAVSNTLTDKKAGMLFMGDWAKGVWHESGKVAMQDYLCVDVPESENTFSYNIDSFVFFERPYANPINMSKKIFVSTLMSDEFQYGFNIEKGSLPVRNNLDMSVFDACTQKSYTDFNNVQLVPSLSQNMATSSYLQSELGKIISGYFKSDTMTAEQVTKQLALAVRVVNK